MDELQIRIIIYGIHMLKYVIPLVEVFLISVVDGAQRIPPEGAVGISQVEHHAVVAVLGEQLRVKLEQLTLRIRAYHG